MSPMPPQSRHVRRRPTGMGWQVWGPLPWTRDMHIMWCGPGDYLQMFATDPLAPQSEAVGQRIRHPSASGEYQTVAEAQRAVDAFIAAFHSGADGKHDGSD